MSNLDVLWKQRLQNYRRALLQLKMATGLAKSRELSELERQGLIQAFEFTHELAWNVISFQGASNIKGSRDATREAFRAGLISEGGHGWK